MKASKKVGKINDKKRMLCDDLDFILHEEYRLLRTNIKYSLSDGKKSHCIGITSSIKGEAKTTAAINLAYTIAENGEKVCLLEADMRLPTVKKKLELEPCVGLSEYLTSQAELKDVLQELTFKKSAFSCIQAGALPPNPAELLSSSKMEELLEALSKEFTYVIVDLPPVAMVSDALVVGSKIDGMLMAVAQPICTKKLLKESMRQLLLARIKVLGFVRTLTSENTFDSKYGRKHKYHHGYQYAKYEYSREPEGENQAQEESSDKGE